MPFKNITKQNCHFIIQVVCCCQHRIAKVTSDARSLLIIEDDGSGFDVEALDKEKGVRRLGLVGIRERAALLQPQAREAFAAVLSQGWTDALQRVHPKKTPFTFWDYRRNRWQRDAGLRIDHLLLNAAVFRTDKVNARTDGDASTRSREGCAGCVGDGHVWRYWNRATGPWLSPGPRRPWLPAGMANRVWRRRSVPWRR